MGDDVVDKCISNFIKQSCITYSKRRKFKPKMRQNAFGGRALSFETPQLLSLLCLQERRPHVSLGWCCYVPVREESENCEYFAIFWKMSYRAGLTGQLRPRNKYPTVRARTNRFKNSFIPYAIANWRVPCKNPITAHNRFLAPLSKLNSTLQISLLFVFDGIIVRSQE